jgi:hypothetical protein
MEAKSIILFLVIFLLVLIVLNYIMKDVNTLSSLTSAKTAQTIEPADLAGDSGNTGNFTYSIWFFIDDWNYRYGEAKVLFGRMSTTQNKSPCPSVIINPLQNNIEVSLSVYPSAEDLSDEAEEIVSEVASVVHTCQLANVPLQKWCNLLVSVYGRTMDLYLDGKMVRTCVMPGTAKIDANAPVYITPNGGFSGWTARFQYWAESSNPQKAWDVYKAGYGGSLLSSIFGKYTVKLSLMEGDTESSSVEL